MRPYSLVVAFQPTWTIVRSPFFMERMRTPALWHVGPLILRPMPWLPLSDWLRPAPCTASVVVYRSSSERLMPSPLSAHERYQDPVAWSIAQSTSYSIRPDADGSAPSRCGGGIASSAFFAASRYSWSGSSSNTSLSPR